MNCYRELEIGQRIEINSYKHDGKIHRVWKYGYVVDITDDCLVILNNKTRVIESSGRVWYTKEPAVCFFFVDKWYNIISMIRSSGIHYYCNIASPFIYDGEAIKYIDYDLDLKVYPNDSMRILDENEFEWHSKTMKYPDKIDAIVHNELNKLQSEVLNPENIYSRDKVYEYLNQFKEAKMDKKKLK